MNCDTRPDNGIWTAVGCVSRTNVTSLTTSAITLAISIAGGISLLLILYGAFFVSTSQGDPQKLQQGKETVTSAIAGLVFIILSVSLLSFIGTDLLQLPGF